MSGTLLFIGLVLAIAGIAWYILQNKTKQEDSSSDNSAPEQNNQDLAEVSNIKKSFESIIQTEEAFALGNLASTTLNESLGSVGDRLIAVLPAMNDDFPNAEVTFKLNEMADKILPAKVAAFVAMDEQSQISRTEGFQDDMVKLLGMADKADNIARQTNLSKDERETLLIGIKY